jgi:sugar phosphate isomerase/epimerase
MNRRDFIHKTSQAALALPFLRGSNISAGRRMGIVVHSYAHRWESKVPSAQYPGFRNALDLLDHCSDIGAGGIQVVVRNWTRDFSKNVRDKREKSGLYLEGSIGLPKSSTDKARFEEDIKSAREAGAEIVRTVCLGTRRYETFHTPEEFVTFRRDSLASLKLAEPVVRKYKVKLAIENHKDWRAAELAAVLKALGSEWIGVTLDFGNSIALLEDPMEVVNTLAPYIFSTHVKDMAVQEYTDGFLLSEVPLGNGFLDLRKIVSVCREHNPKVNFNLEMITRDPLKIPCLTDDYWATFGSVGGKELARTLRMVKDHRYPSRLPEVSSLSPEEQLAVEERNILSCLDYSASNLDMD